MSISPAFFRVWCDMDIAYNNCCRMSYMNDYDLFVGHITITSSLHLTTLT